MLSPSPLTPPPLQPPPAVKTRRKKFSVSQAREGRGCSAVHVWASPDAFPPGRGAERTGSPGTSGPQSRGRSAPVLRELPGERMALCAPRRPVRVPPGPGPAVWDLTLVA